MLLISAVAALLGLWCLLAPPRAMLFGSRWQLRNGDKAEPSTAWIAYTRASGVVLILVAIGVLIWFFVAQGQSQTRASLKEAWGIGLFTSVGDLQIDLDPEVQTVDDVEATLAGYTGKEQGLPVWRSAIVGQDAVGDLGADAHDGDLVVAVLSGGCRPGPVLVDETDTTVTVSVTGIGYTLRDDVVVICGAKEAGSLLPPDAESLRLVRVPLAAPLGDRELMLPTPPERDQGSLFPQQNLPTPAP